MNNICILWISVMFVLSQGEEDYKTNLIKSYLKNQMFSVRFDVDLLKLDTAKIRGMIGQLNETVYLENKCSNAEDKETRAREDIEITTGERISSSQDNGHVTQLVKSFRDEKLFYREKMDELMKYQEVLQQNIEHLESENTALNKKHIETIENFKAYSKKNEIDVEISKNRTTETVERVTDLESDVASVKESVRVSKGIISKLEKLKPQLNALQSRIENLETSQRCVEELETSHRLVEELDELKVNKCESQWVYNKVLDSCYLFSSEEKKWNEAESFCNDNDARLVEIPNAQTQEQVRRIYEENGGFDFGRFWYGDYVGFWTGGCRPVNNNNWRWKGSQTPIRWSHWNTGEPEGRPDYKCCISVLVNDKYFRWSETPWYFTKHFICEKITTQNLKKKEQARNCLFNDL